MERAKRFEHPAPDRHRNTDNRRTRHLSISEVGKLGQALAALELEGINPKALDICRLWALTGCRRDEIAGLKWAEVDFERHS